MPTTPESTAATPASPPVPPHVPQGVADAGASIDLDVHDLDIRELDVRDLSRRVSGRTLVDRVTVAIRQGEILAIVGPSGAGKSSFIRLLNRLDEPTGGTVLFKRQDYRQIDPRVLRQRVGMVLQTPFLFPGTVAANLAFGPAQRGRTLPADEIAALLAKVELPGYEPRDVSTLSGGEAQRVSLARSLANQPEVLLLDEPTSALDEENVRGIEQLIMTINRTSGTTCVIVTHNREQALRIAPRTLYLDAGRLVAVGNTREVLDAH
ncbi:ABC transporter ATP-binding protein [Ancylobacter amanitiformis]|uniref:ABC transport system ATP-binding protein n=1 Tax=Ancylobacter amanitiformis TaxID=217069 RepID=A0ABU0LUV8_9HYPH|nr:phosphate ABC transporter ATP-binding protein [Ancylobacter amanitiformis]MDQ0512463.1 putative ABC transport system ATP-binding protein [Ancylobacter amanitiformis]